MFYERIFREFYQQQLKYAVIGGVAVNLHGFNRATGDLDIVLAMNDTEIAKFITVIKKLGMIPRLPVKLEDFADEQKREEWISQKNMLVFSVYNPNDPIEHIDVKIEGQDDWKHLINNSKNMAVKDFEVPVIDIEDLIAMKIKAGRGRDLNDVQALRKIQELRNGK